MIALTVLLLFCAGNEVLSSLVKEQSEKIFYDLDNAENIFADFVKEYNKVYDSDDERNKRFEIFKMNLKETNELNKESQIAYKINQYSDLAFTEFSYRFLSPKTQEYEGNFKSIPESELTFPSSIDYRQLGYVTSVKDQGYCSAGYAFATIASIETLYAMVYGQEPVDFSAQQIIDCNSYDMGCEGGSAGYAFATLAEKPQIMKEIDYPYAMEEQDQCNVKKSKVMVEVDNYIGIISRNKTDALKYALARHGPVAVDMEVCFALLVYSGGIFNKPCNGKMHTVLIVGFGFDPKTNQEYFIIKNSWGEKWGEQGYLRMAPAVIWPFAYVGVLKL